MRFPSVAAVVQAAPGADSAAAILINFFALVNTAADRFCPLASHRLAKVHLLLEHFEDVPHDAVVDVEFPRRAVHARGIGATARRVPSCRGAPLMAAAFSTLLYSITGWVAALQRSSVADMRQPSAFWD